MYQQCNCVIYNDSVTMLWASPEVRINLCKKSKEFKSELAYTNINIVVLAIFKWSRSVSVYETVTHLEWPGEMNLTVRTKSKSDLNLRKRIYIVKLSLVWLSEKKNSHIVISLELASVTTVDKGFGMRMRKSCSRLLWGRLAMHKRNQFG